MNIKTTKEIWQTGKPEDLSIGNVIVIVKNLYNKNLAEAWFIGAGWVEGFVFCQNHEYLANTAANILRETKLLPLWFACRFLD